MATMHECDGVRWCECGCHRDGSSLMHIRACCDVGAQKYITTDGLIDPKRLKPLVEEVKARRVKMEEQAKHRQELKNSRGGPFVNEFDGVG